MTADVSPREASYKVAPAARDGERRDDFILKRKYTFGEDTVSVRDQVGVKRPPRCLAWVGMGLGKKTRVFHPKQNDTIVIEYEL